MNIKKVVLVATTILALVFTLPVARASDEDQASKLTFNKPVQVPGRVLPAGTYWFVLEENNTSRNVVHIFNSDRSVLYATILTVNAERSNPTGNTTITFAEGNSMQPDNIVTWFYPGMDSGHEFVYSRPQLKGLTQVKQYTVVASAKDQSHMKTIVNGD